MSTKPTFEGVNAGDDQVDTCPECGGHNVEKRHHAPTFAVPECDYKECEDCQHQWDHQ
jgi:hypothetical protein